MTDTTGTTLSGLYAKGRPFPDISYPRRRGWFNTKTNFSGDTTTADMFLAASGGNLTKLNLAKRGWALSTPPARAAVDSLDLTTPSYMLAGSNALNDAIVGLDHYNMPLDLSNYLFALNNTNDLGARGQGFMRVLAYKHKLHFTNFHRFPLKIYYTVYTWGNEPGDLVTNETTLMPDVTNKPYYVFTVPPVKDLGDRGSKRTLDLTMNLQNLFKDAYEIPPMTTNDTTSAVDFGDTPWIQVDATTTACQYTTCPPGQIQQTVGSSIQNSSRFQSAVYLKMFARVDFPVNMGVASGVTPTGGQIDTSGFTIEGDMNWLVDFVNVTKNSIAHRGENAYPDQT